MKRFALLPAAGLVAALALASPGLQAQQVPPGPVMPVPSPLPEFTSEEASLVLNARIAALRTVIGLSPDQEKLWPPVESAIRQIAADAAKRRAQFLGAAPPASFLDVLRHIASSETERGKDLLRLVEAAKPLVDSLSPAQQRRMPAFLGIADLDGAVQPSATLWLFEAEES